MMKIRYDWIWTLVLIFLMTLARPLSSAEEETALPDIGPRLSQADSREAAAIVEDSIADCRIYDDYEKFVSEIKKLSQDPAAKNMDVLCYAIAKARVKQLIFLSKSNDIQAGRLYMTMNDQYYNEALEYIERASPIASSQRLAIDISFLKFLIFKEKLQPQKADAALDEIASRMVLYSGSPKESSGELSRISDSLDEMDLADYALRLKLIYASKADSLTAREVMEGIRKGADESFARGDTKGANALYEQYIKQGHAYFDKESMAQKVMEIAEKYYSAAKYREARGYYEFYGEQFPDSNVKDYCDYQIVICFYQEKDVIKALAQAEHFLDVYRNSVWFDKAFDILCKLYYTTYPKDKAIGDLNKAIDKYYRKNTGDYARVLITMLYYGDKKYDKALEELKKIEPDSVYSYSAEMITDDIGRIKKKRKTPAFGLHPSTDTYRIWEPNPGITLTVVPFEAEPVKGKKLEYVYKDNALYLIVNADAKIRFDIEALEDLDGFEEYLQDKEDMSRLPKKIKEETAKDILSIEWVSDGGSFLDQKQSRSKVWQAPHEPGAYKVSVRIDDIGLVSSPDKGLRKDSARELTLVLDVK